MLLLFFKNLLLSKVEKKIQRKVKNLTNYRNEIYKCGKIHIGVGSYYTSEYLCDSKPDQILKLKSILRSIKKEDLDLYNNLKRLIFYNDTKIINPFIDLNLVNALFRDTIFKYEK